MTYLSRKTKIYSYPCTQTVKIVFIGGARLQTKEYAQGPSYSNFTVKVLQIQVWSNVTISLESVRFIHIWWLYLVSIKCRKKPTRSIPQQGIPRAVKSSLPCSFCKPKLYGYLKCFLLKFLKREVLLLGHSSLFYPATPRFWLYLNFPESMAAKFHRMLIQLGQSADCLTGMWVLSI